ncbi:uncharacterized protein cubi_00847 [Cryptosporidium ubiquitum]|uniref:Uncharacterized protein n=1 Tax=Cryptosporidium ubiquitum TaxID=857276 RepID=A0A1J4MHD6_9CRYT|nr:uncharacterized protein cubi_00847 [Cryptosporidium ubiquitum]OII72875.1 hypothetical protein cubi_00847 [Cryptosporidium ubiquitum]
MNLLESSINEYLGEEFILDPLIDNYYFQSDTTHPTFSVGFEEDNIYSCDNVQTFQEDSDFIEHFDQNNLGLNWDDSYLFDQKRHKELKDFTLELASDPSPNSEFLFKVVEILNSALEDKFKVLDSQVSPFVE